MIQRAHTDSPSLVRSAPSFARTLADQMRADSRQSCDRHPTYEPFFWWTELEAELYVELGIDHAEVHANSWSAT